MGKGLGLAAISEARANASVSIYSRMFVTLPFRTVMAKTQWSSNVDSSPLAFVKHERSCYCRRMDLSAEPNPTVSEPKPIELGILIYPGMTLLDFAGPHAAL